MYTQLINPSVMFYTYVLITTKYFKEFQDLINRINHFVSAYSLTFHNELPLTRAYNRCNR